ncbi:glycosyltransferase family 4 protein [Vibrio sp. SCSIO 43132]|uniref:glycosyltransferase family 4 protein n=1 Tax=Vibrio sp. SCSIO 43132 TaxID=2779363 RepID=UPI001CA9C618|nr:glycosyltransferase family 4 protein [Vibrio sp. SCSIO 43132]UAB71913.1 glycosyltransferase family 4 protein [Vibrio sp. SCSIO 43132]
MDTTTNILLVQYDNSDATDVVARLRAICSGLQTQSFTVTLWHCLDAETEFLLQREFPEVLFYSSDSSSTSSLAGWYQKYQVGKRIVRTESISLIHCLDSLSCQWMNWVANHCDVPIMVDVEAKFTSVDSLPLGIRLMPKLIAPGNHVASALKSLGYPGEQIEVVQRPVAATVSPSHRAKVLDLNTHFNLENDAFVLINSEPLTQESGIDALIQALTMARMEYPNAHLVLLGQGEERSQLEQQAMLLDIKDAVHFVYSPDDHTPYFEQADAYISGARKDGARDHIVRAGRCGLPAIAPMIGSNPEVIRQGMTGFLALAHSHVSLAEAIEMMASDNNRLTYFSEQARYLAQRLSDPKRYCVTLAAIYLQEIESHYEYRYSAHLSPLLNNLGYITKLLTGGKASGGSL